MLLGRHGSAAEKTTARWEPFLIMATADHAAPTALLEAFLTALSSLQPGPGTSPRPEEPQTRKDQRFVQGHPDVIPRTRLEIRVSFQGVGAPDVVTLKIDQDKDPHLNCRTLKGVSRCRLHC